MSRSVVLAFSALFLATSLLLGDAAAAGAEWCEEDPTFIVNGSLVDITTTFPYRYAGTVSGPVEFELLVPENVNAAAVALPGTVPVTAKIRQELPAWRGIGLLPVVARVTVRARASFDTQTRVTGLNVRLTWTVPGRSNDTTHSRFSLIGFAL